MKPPVVAPPSVRVIVGPTAAGKSDIAMRLAERYSGAILSADSRQVYEGFDVGTAKPTRADRERVPHYGIDVLSPTVRYSAHRWVDEAIGWIRDAQANGRTPLIVGGTGFYIRALAEPLDAAPALDPSRRTALEQWLATLDAEEIERWCRRLDPPRAALGRTQRLRAIETALLSGTRLSDWHAAAPTHASSPDHEPSGQRANDPTAVPRLRYLVVDPGPVLATRIETRVASMMAAGWMDEVLRLMTHVPLDAPAWNASGYGTVLAAVRGTIVTAEAVQRVIIETRQYAKRQRTWFRNQLPAECVTRIDSSEPNAFELACAWWESEDGSGT